MVDQEITYGGDSEGASLSFRAEGFFVTKAVLKLLFYTFFSWIIAKEDLLQHVFL